MILGCDRFRYITYYLFCIKIYYVIKQCIFVKKTREWLYYTIFGYFRRRYTYYLFLVSVCPTVNIAKSVWFRTWVLDLYIINTYYQIQRVEHFLVSFVDFFLKISSNNNVMRFNILINYNFIRQSLNSTLVVILIYFLLSWLYSKIYEYLYLIIFYQTDD